jgi:hypothetical protein
MVPSAVQTVELPPHFPDLRVDAVVTEIKPFYAKFWHVCNLTPLPAPSLSGIGAADSCSRSFKTSPPENLVN